MPSRVHRAIPESAVTLSLAEIAALAMQEELVTLLVQLADETLRDAADSKLEGSRKDVGAFLMSSVRYVTENHVDATPDTFGIVAQTIAANHSTMYFPCRVKCTIADFRTSC